MATIAKDGIWTDRSSVTGELALKCLEYTDCIKRTVEAAKAPGFNESGWDELAALLDTDVFERVGNDKVAMGWEVYRGLLMQWATSSDFWAEFHRVSQVGNLVFLELTEHNTLVGGDESVVNSLTSYQYDDAGRMVRLGIYLQHD
ncbi:MAG: hypothetical protein P8J20_13660 [Novosphingobium sp.]|nr:hypothetical protein [Novosphingobium sp.]